MRESKFALVGALIGLLAIVSIACVTTVPPNEDDFIGGTIGIPGVSGGVGYRNGEVQGTVFIDPIAAGCWFFDLVELDRTVLNEYICGIVQPVDETAVTVPEDTGLLPVDPTVDTQ